MNFNYQPPTLGGRRIARKSEREVAYRQFRQVIAFASDSGHFGRGYGRGYGIALRIPMRIRERACGRFAEIAPRPPQAAGLPIFLFCTAGGAF
jgi:hypothetical protein